jgi:hypothetical protein
MLTSTNKQSQKYSLAVRDKSTIGLLHPVEKNLAGRKGKKIECPTTCIASE